MFTRSVFVVLVLLVSTVFLSGCATASRQTDVAESERVQLPARIFFGYMVYTMESHEVAGGMRELEELLFERLPDNLRDQHGDVPEEYLAALYRDASGGDRYITTEGFEIYKNTFLREMEHSFPDPLRQLRRRR